MNMEEYNISITNLSKLTIDGLKPLTSLEENDEKFCFIVQEK